MEGYDPERMERSTRDLVARACFTEVLEGRGTPNGGVWIDVAHLGPELVERSFKGMVKRCRDFGFDLAHDPVEVGPTAHFMMGGVVIDPACRTDVEGLFAAGEDTGGVHGANRLGGNGVAESTVFGGIAGDTMAEWVIQRALPRASRASMEATARRIQAPLGRAPGADEDLYTLQSRLRALMWDEVGLIRTGAGLRTALTEIEEITRRAERVGVSGGVAYNLAWQDWLNLQSQTTAAWLIARSALERAESRGSHFRSDCPQPAAALSNVCIALADGLTPKVWTEPVRLTRLDPSAARPAAMVEVGD
jgi:succinate dehydrogenase/fumarate reductase flavoprotein subunit